jgi:hypothetical protein
MENTFNFEQAGYTDLLTEAKRLNGLVADLSNDLTTLQNKMLYVERAFANRDRQFTEAKDLLTELIENEEISDEDSVKKIVELFGIEILKEVEFTITVELTGTLQLPMGTELDEYSFNVDSLSYNGEDVDFNHDTTDISGWNFIE